jgi:ACT domain-containing protein
MTRDDIIRMAREAGFEVIEEDEYRYTHIIDTLCHIDVAVERFANLVAAAERERCAKVAAWVLKMPENDVSAAIRARGNNE